MGSQRVSKLLELITVLCRSTLSEHILLMGCVFLRGTEHPRHCFIIAMHILMFVHLCLKDSRESNNTDAIIKRAT